VLVASSVGATIPLSVGARFRVAQRIDDVLEQRRLGGSRVEQEVQPWRRPSALVGVMRARTRILRRLSFGA